MPIEMIGSSNNGTQELNDPEYVALLADFRRKYYEQDPTAVVAGLLAEDYERVAALLSFSPEYQEQLGEPADWLEKAAYAYRDAYQLSGDIGHLNNEIFMLRRVIMRIEYRPLEKKRVKILKKMLDDALDLKKKHSGS